VELFVHVFFVDMVSLSDRNLGSTETQNKKLETMFRYITNSKILKNSQDSTITSHTGDGVAICFTKNPRLPLELAIDLHKKLNRFNKNKSKKEKILVRIGINSGLISKTRGVKGQGNYWGRGLIHAQRIMSAGDASHILLSANTAQELIEISDEYKQNIHYIGNIEIKHEEVIPVYSAYGECFGNKNNLKFTQQPIQEESGRVIFEGLKKNEINPKKLLELLKQNKQTKLSLPSKKKRRKN